MSDKQINLVLSYSQQTHNKCAMGDTEQDHTKLIADAIYAKISKDTRIKCRCIPKQSDLSDNVNLRLAVASSNEFINNNGGTGYHLSIHTDGGYNGTGASGFYASEAGKCFGRFIYEEMCQLTPWKDMQFSLRPGLYELNHTKAIAFLLEVAFHDKPDQARWIHENIDKIADAITRGIYKGMGIEPYKETDKGLETALKFLAENANINYDLWLKHAQSRRIPFLDVCFQKIAEAWENSLNMKG